MLYSIQELSECTQTEGNTLKIKLIISVSTLGDVDTPADNQRYADAVKSRIKQQYPDAEVHVSLSNSPTDALCHVTGFRDNYWVSGHVKDITAKV